jgi:hypothetical protein
MPMLGVWQLIREKIECPSYRPIEIKVLDPGCLPFTIKTYFTENCYNHVKKIRNTSAISAQLKKCGYASIFHFSQIIQPVLAKSKREKTICIMGGQRL